MRISYTTLTTFNPSETVSSPTPLQPSLPTFTLILHTDRPKNLTQETPNLLSLIPPSAQTRILRFRRTEDQNRSLIGWLSLERWKCTQGYTRGLEDYIEWGEGGKPLFISTGTEDPQRAVGYNIAHDEDLVIFAIEVEEPAETPSTTSSQARSKAKTDLPLPGGLAVGVDCMRLDRDAKELRELDEVLVDQLTEDELRGLPPPTPAGRDVAQLRRRTDHLLTLWTIKEAYTKLLGLGLGLDLKRVEVEFSRPLPEILSRGGGEGGSHGRLEREKQDGECHICDGSIRISQDSQELVAPLHLVVGMLSTGSHDSSSPNETGGQDQVYVWACFWRSTEGCRGWSMERVQGSELVGLGTGASRRSS